MAKKSTQKKAGTPGTETMTVQVVKAPFAQEQQALAPEAERLRALTITNDDEAKKVHEKMSWIARTLKTLDEKRKDLLKPLNELRDKITKEFKSTADPLEQAKGILKGKLDQYDQVQREKQQAAQQVYQRQVEQAAVQGQSPLDVPVPVPRAAPIPTSRYAEWEVVDETQIPYSFRYMLNGRVEEVPLWVLNTVEINKLRRAYGVECEESPIPGIKFTVRHGTVAR